MSFTISPIKDYMNFKPKIIKLITTLIVSIIIGIHTFQSTFITDLPTSALLAIKLQRGLIGIVISSIAIYVIWSLIEKKG